MSTYKSDYNDINYNIATVFAKLSNPQVFKAQLDKNLEKMPDEARENIEKLQFDEDGISIASPMGPVKLSVADSIEPSKVVFAAQNSPVKFQLVIDLQEIDTATTRSLATIDIDLPLMIRTMVGGQLSEATKKIGEMLAQLPFDDL